MKKRLGRHFQVVALESGRTWSSTATTTSRDIWTSKICATCRAVEIKFYGTFVLPARHRRPGVATPSTRRLLDGVAMRGDFHTGAAGGRHRERGPSSRAAGLSSVNDQFFVAQGATFGRVARLYEYIPSLYDDAQCTFHPEHLLGYAAVAALRLELRYYEAPPPDPVALPEPVPGFASASGREEAPCDFAAAGYTSGGIRNGRGRGCEFNFSHFYRDTA